jgi:hypothetical protein
MYKLKPGSYYIGDIYPFIKNAGDDYINVKTKHQTPGFYLDNYESSYICISGYLGCMPLHYIPTDIVRLIKLQPFPNIYTSEDEIYIIYSKDCLIIGDIVIDLT